jgi:cytidylate kinase
LLDGEDVTTEIRTREVASAASQVSVHPAVRRDMVERQRRLGEQGGVILDGRDIGTHVFPDAEVKFYVDADPAQRALRRQRELVGTGAPTELAVVEAEIRARDHRDRTRASAPLVCAEGAVFLDTTRMSPDQVVERMLAVVRESDGSQRDRKRSGG